MFPKILNYIYRLDLAGYWPKSDQNEFLSVQPANVSDVVRFLARFFFCRQPSFMTNICTTTHLTNLQTMLLYK